MRIFSYALTPGEVHSVYVSGAVGENANPPQITSVSGTALNSGQFQLNFTGSYGYPYRIWSTTNISLTPVTNTWTLVTSGMLTSGVNTFTDTAATDTTEFYTITVP